MSVSGLYPILTESLVDPHDFVDVAGQLAGAGVSVMQLRFKTTADSEAAALQEAVADRLRDWGGTLVINDRAELAEILWRHVRDAAHQVRVGLHLGQTDLPARVARGVVSDAVAIGVSTHDLEQLAEALAEPPDVVGHVAFGPVFQTHTKHDPDPVVGLEALRSAASLAHQSQRPLVAIGGIGPEDLAAVRAAGADAVAVISGLFSDGRAGLESRLRRYLEAAESD